MSAKYSLQTNAVRSFSGNDQKPRAKTELDALNCPQCGDKLQLALLSNDGCKTSGMKEGDIVRCKSCRLYFAVKASTAPSAKQNVNGPMLPGVHNQRQALTILQREQQPKESAVEAKGNLSVEATSSVLTPKQIYEGLNEYVVGQDKVKKTLSVGVYNHYKRLSVLDGQKKATEEDERIKRLESHSETSLRSQMNQAMVEKGRYKLDMDQQDQDSLLRMQKHLKMAETLSEDERVEQDRKLNALMKRMNHVNPVAKEKTQKREIAVKKELKTAEAAMIEMDKTNILVLGPTGSGKCFCFKSELKSIRKNADGENTSEIGECAIGDCRCYLFDASGLCW